jgi:hypothetical protein
MATETTERTSQSLQLIAARRENMRNERRIRVLLRGIGREYGDAAEFLAEHRDTNTVLVPGALLHDEPEKCGECVCGFHPVAVEPTSPLFAEIEKAAGGGE